MSERLTLVTRRLIRAGEMMSNLCFNGRQNSALPDDYRDSMAKCQSEWDEAVAETVKMRRDAKDRRAKRTA